MEIETGMGGLPRWTGWALFRVGFGWMAVLAVLVGLVVRGLRAMGVVRYNSVSWGIREVWRWEVFTFLGMLLVGFATYMLF